jgi:hypothetical protein
MECANSGFLFPQQVALIAKAVQLDHFSSVFNKTSYLTKIQLIKSVF